MSLSTARITAGTGKKVRKQVLAEKAEEDSGAETHRLRKEVRRLAARCQQLEQQLRVRQQSWQRDYEGSRRKDQGEVAGTRRRLTRGIMADSGM